MPTTRMRRRTRECVEHQWIITENVGLRRSVCAGCGSVTIEPVDHELAVSAALAQTAPDFRT